MACIAKGEWSQKNNLDVQEHREAWDRHFTFIKKNWINNDKLCPCVDRILPDTYGYKQFINYIQKDKPLSQIPKQFDCNFAKLFADMQLAYDRCVAAGRCPRV